MKNAIKDIWGLLKGMGVTFKYMFTKPVTVQYPKERVKVSPRWRGTLKQLYDEKGVELCGRMPDLAQDLSGELHLDGCFQGTKRPGSGKTSSYTINFGRCMYCGLCVESCPKKCLVHTPDFEFCTYDRESLILNKDKILR